MDTYIKGIIEAVKRQDMRAASENLEKLREVVPENMRDGYVSALSGMMNAVQGNDPNSLFLKVIKGEMLKRETEEIRKDFKKRSEEPFRAPEERAFQRAWYDILSIMLDKRKVGLEKLVK
jgi:hypothetical protein